MNIYRADSKLAVAYDAFLTGGIEAAFKKGLEIGLSIATLKTQVKRKNWGGNIPVKIPGEVKARIANPVSSTKPRFLLSKKGKRQVIMVHEGEQQSVVRFIDTGDEQCIVNSWLVPVK